MKKTALALLLFSYSMVMLKPVTPYVSDAVAHIFYYSRHMATVHYENGKMHVHREMVQHAAKDQPSKELPASKKDDTGGDHVILKRQPLPTTGMISSFNINYCSKLPFNYLAAEYPPPKA